MVGILNFIATGRVVLHQKNRPAPIQPEKTECLTLVGFEETEMGKLYDAIEICSTSKDIQAVEIFIESSEGFNEESIRDRTGLCLIKVPKHQGTQGFKNALQAIASAIKNENLTTIPVPDCMRTMDGIPKGIRSAAPYYINVNSGVTDFTSMFSAYLFAPEGESQSGRTLVNDAKGTEQERSRNDREAQGTPSNEIKITRKRRSYKRTQ